MNEQYSAVIKIRLTQDNSSYACLTGDITVNVDPIGVLASSKVLPGPMRVKNFAEYEDEVPVHG